MRQGFRIEDWQVRPTAGELVDRDGGIFHLEPKVMEVLVELARAYPDVLERENAIRAVWGSRPVSDDSLARCVAVLRKAFGDDRAEPRFIQTVPKRGYRLVAAVETGPRARDPITRATPDEIEAWPGPTEFDNLRIIRLLGRGSMGVVHLAQETNLERLVAVKTLRGVITGDGRAEKRFRREANAAARIDHPNVTSVYRLGDLADGTPYIVMQYVRGRTLSALMTSSGEIARQTAISMIRQIARGLEAAHRQGIVHRDVKPGNVLIEHESGVAILSDFGIAGIQETGSRIATRLTMHGEMLGDARYISPEQARGDPPTPASDVYSLGVIAYELLTGAYPYPQDGNDVSSHLHEEARPMAGFRSGIESAVERVVMQALAKKSDDRPTVEQFLAGLDRGSSSGALETQGDVPAFQTRRMPIAALLAVVAIIAIVIAALLFGD